MKFLVLFKDSASVEPDLRQRHMAQHLDFLERNGEEIQAAGPLFTSNGDAAGGAWVVDAQSGQAVEALIREDPFWPTGLRNSIEILQWDQVFAEGRRLIVPS